MSETPFNVHDWECCQYIRKATRAEAMAALTATCIEQRLWGNEFFPLYRGQEKADILAWVEKQSQGKVVNDLRVEASL